MGASKGTRLTPRRIESLKPQEKPYRVPDPGAPAPGLLMVVYPSGRRTWLSRVTIRRPEREGLRVDVQQGPWPMVDLGAAREKHRQAVAAALEGYDPRRLVSAADAVPLFGELMEQWLAHLARLDELSPATIADHRRRWKSYLSRLDGLRVSELTRQHIAPELTRAAHQSPTRCRATLSTLRSALQWAYEKAWVSENVAANMRAKAFGGTAGKRREVVLTLEELREVWAALDVESLSPAIAAALRLAILTGCRRAEVAGACWEEIDLEAGVWRLPAERTKTGTARPVFLSPEAVALLREHVSSEPPQSGPVFTADSRRLALHPDSLTTALRRLQRQPGKRSPAGPLAALGKRKPFTVHDLRRSAATWWGEALGAAPHVIDAALGHAPRNAVTATYQRQHYETEQRDMLRRWGALVRDHVAQAPGETVTPFRRTAAVGSSG